MILQKGLYEHKLAIKPRMGLAVGLWYNEATHVPMRSTRRE